jgi:hypothetical protein
MKLNTWTPIKLNTWKIIKVGTGLKTGDDFKRALEKGGFGISDWANKILERYDLKAAATETEAELVKVSVSELVYFKDRCATTNEVYACAKTYFGLDPCSPEVGPQLRLQYLNQPKDEWLHIAMSPIVWDSNFTFDVLHSSRGELLLGGYDDPTLRDLRATFVFCQRK